MIISNISFGRLFDRVRNKKLLPLFCLLLATLVSAFDKLSTRGLQLLIDAMSCGARRWVAAWVRS